MIVQQLLKMIEEADPTDMAKLDEIDANVCNYLYRPAWDGFGWKEQDNNLVIYSICNNHWILSPKYTRSRDALKAIRPDGWEFVIDIREGNASVCFAMDCDHQKLGDWFTASTEELAELHAIIQAIEFERMNK